MCGCLLLKHVNELKPPLQTVEWRDSHFFSKKQSKSWAVLSCFLSCSLNYPLDGPTAFWCRERLICLTQGWGCCAGLLICARVVLMLGKWCCALSSQAMAFAWNQLHTPSIHLRVWRCCVLMALTMCTVITWVQQFSLAIICLLGKIVHVRLYSLWQFWPVIFQMIIFSTLSKYFWLWLHSWTEVRNTK